MSDRAGNRPPLFRMIQENREKAEDLLRVSKHVQDLLSGVKGEALNSSAQVGANPELSPVETLAVTEQTMHEMRDVLLQIRTALVGDIGALVHT